METALKIGKLKVYEAVSEWMVCMVFFPVSRLINGCVLSMGAVLFLFSYL